MRYKVCQRRKHYFMYVVDGSGWANSTHSLLRLPQLQCRTISSNALLTRNINIVKLAHNLFILGVEPKHLLFALWYSINTLFVLLNINADALCNWVWNVWKVCYRLFCASFIQFRNKLVCIKTTANQRNWIHFGKTSIFSCTFRM